MEDKSPVVDGPVYDLTEVVEEGVPVDFTALPPEVMDRLAVVAERVAREMFPEIAERIVREEIARLKENRE
jgi:hypothetical protein